MRVPQLSAQTRLGPEHHFRLGQVLAALRKEGVLILGSGSFSHDRSSFRLSGGNIDAPEPDWVRRFADSTASPIREDRFVDLQNDRKRAPEAADNHPTDEDLLLLYVALGAGAGRISHLHQSTTYGMLRTDAFDFR